MIVLCSHGYGGIDRLIGTTASKVVNLADRSVLVVRDPPSSVRQKFGRCEPSVIKRYANAPDCSLLRQAKLGRGGREVANRNLSK